MKKLGILIALVTSLSLVLVSSAFAQHQATDRGNLNYQYQGRQTEPGVSHYYEQQGSGAGFSSVAPGTPPASVTVESIVPPPTRSDVGSERINRTNAPPLQTYVEREQGVPTSIAPEGRPMNTHRGVDHYGPQARRPTAQGYYPESGQSGENYIPNK